MTKKLDINGMTEIVDSGTTAREFLEYKPPVATPISSSPITPKTASTPLSLVTSPVEANNRTIERPVERPNDRTEKKAKRYTHRNSFEIYDDQFETLKKIRREAEDDGEFLPISKIVRDALDAYFKKLGK